MNAESVLQITDGCHDHSIMIRVKYARSVSVKGDNLTDYFML